MTSFKITLPRERTEIQSPVVITSLHQRPGEHPDNFGKLPHLHPADHHCDDNPRVLIAVNGFETCDTYTALVDNKISTVGDKNPIWTQ